LYFHVHIGMINNITKIAKITMPMTGSVF
jgi:hypothetical protein